MTLEPYDADRLDALTMRFLDLAATFRRMAQAIRVEGLECVDLHTTRPLEHLGRLEHWVRDSDAKLQVELFRQRAERQAEELPVYGRKSGSESRNSPRKKRNK